MYVPLTVSNDMPQPNLYQMNDYKQVTNQTNCLQLMVPLLGVQIMEQFKPTTVSFGYQNTRFFNIFPTNHCGQLASQKPIFESVETAQPITIFGNLQPILLFVEKSMKSYTQQMPNSPYKEGLFLKLERKGTFSCCCFNRPRLDIIYIENGQNILLGQIEVPYSLIYETCKVYDRNNELKYTITKKLLGKSTKLALFPWNERESQVLFDIKDTRGQTISQMRKQTKSRFNMDISVNFSLLFPQNSVPEEKALILAAALMFECMYF